MKKKPLLITIICLLVVCACVFAFVKAKYFRKPDSSEITQFIKDFDAQLRSGNMDSLRNDFAGGGNVKIMMLLKTLANKNSLGSKETPDFTTNLDADDAQLLMSNSDIAVVKVPVTFSHANYDLKKSYITFTIRRIADHQYKITRVKAEDFAKDYMVYKAKVDQEFAPPKPVEYSAKTLAAFKTAETLKGKYDSVMWFQHVDDKTWFYVVNGTFKKNTWDFQGQLDRDSAKTYKMGLLNPELKEIIPVQYDLVHNINGTIKGMIEVDKDQKHGLYTLDGKLTVPVEYDQIFPINDGIHTAVLRKEDDYFWLNDDLTISPKADIKVADLLSEIKGNLKFKLNPPQTDIMEWNSHEFHGSIYISPSYLVDLNIMQTLQTFQNPLRKNTEDEDIGTQTTAFNVDLDHSTDNPDKPNIFQTLLYDIEDHYIGGRGDLYEKKSLIVLDKLHNRLLSHDIDIAGGEDGDLPTFCRDYSFKTINDSLFEVKVSTSIYISIPNDTISGDAIEEMPAYHYYKVVNNRLVEEKTGRDFAFTKFVKMDDSYLKGCYSYIARSKTDKSYNNVQTSYLQSKYYQYVINEIYAEYDYKFKNQKWNDCFVNMDRYHKILYDNVDDSLTAIDKYNIKWLKQKMATKPMLKGNPLAMR